MAFSQKINDSQILELNEQTAWKWSDTEVVSTESSNPSLEPSIATDSFGNVHVVWYEFDIANDEVFYKYWNATTKSWTAPILISTSDGSRSAYPCITIDIFNNIHVVWMEYTGTVPYVYYRCWNATSQSWMTMVHISTEKAGTAQSAYPDVATDRMGNVHVAWQDDTNYGGVGLDFDIFYKYWNTFTDSWSITEVVSTESSLHSYYPSVSVDSLNNVHVSWQESTSSILYKYRNSTSQLWTTVQQISAESTGIVRYPSLKIDSLDNVHVAWDDTTNYLESGSDGDIFYKYWSNISKSWSTTEVVSTESSENSLFPEICIDPCDNIHVVWRDTTDYLNCGTDQDIFYKHWNTVDKFWSTTEVVSTESNLAAKKPTISVYQTNEIHITWYDPTGYAGSGSDEDIFYRKLTSPELSTPTLAFIVPNPSISSSIELNWNHIWRASTYYIYRDTSYIWNLDNLSPLDSVSTNRYNDYITMNGFYYYVIVAGNSTTNSTFSNCQYVEVKIPSLSSPELAPIVPNPSEIAEIYLDWNDVDGAAEYYVYRNSAYIWSIEGLSPIATTSSSDYTDNLPSEGFYYYVIVANDGSSNSTHSNCHYVEYELPHVNEFTILLSLVGGVLAIFFTLVTLKKRKTNTKSS
ncbi:MAG: hypothetical protein ACFFDS_01295 [Candidatus Thorarchaeota archaeon]